MLRSDNVVLNEYYYYYYYLTNWAGQYASSPRNAELAVSSLSVTVTVARHAYPRRDGQAELVCSGLVSHLRSTQS